MSKYSIDSTTLSAIGNAIKTKKGSNSSILVSDFASEISNLSTSSAAAPVDFLSPFVSQLQFNGKIDYLDSKRLFIVPIPKTIFQQFDTVSFVYSVYAANTSNSNGTNASPFTLSLYYGNEAASQKNSPNTTSFTQNSSSKISDILVDFVGTVSNTHTFNSSTILNNQYDNYTHVIIIGYIKNDNDDSSKINFALCSLGEFGGTTS